ncbi:carboxypeptidase regulatory-like domain-containing protein [Candidatus Viridilinea mediisalina]|nr:carboxypeptidase regulatory-like domain-containing protein [Candidatus Viridilinea mediisalina]
MANPQRRDLQVELPLSCADGTTPMTATVTLGSASFPMSEAPTGSGIFSTTIPAAQVATGALALSYRCAAESLSELLGRVVLYDPSGFVRDATTNQPIAGAVVQLFQVPSYAPKSGPLDTAPLTCETPDTLGNRTWDDLPPADEALGVVAMPDPNLIDPQVNPQITGADGYYGWDVALGCWYVTVEAPGYERRVSAMAGVPPEVLDLHMHLTPIAGATIPTLNFSQADYAVAHGSSSVTVEVQLSAATSGPVTVQYRSSGADGVAALGNLSFAAGETRQQISIPLNTSQLASAEISFTLSLSNPVGARLGEQASSTITLAASNYRISGRITTNAGNGLAGVSVTDGTRTATSGADGSYTLEGVPTGSYTLTPTLDGYHFSPASRSVSVTGNLSDQDFRGTSVSEPARVFLPLVQR